MKGLNSILIFLWGVFNVGGCAYLVFWRGASGWWFLLATLLASSFSSKSTTKSTTPGNRGEATSPKGEE